MKRVSAADRAEIREPVFVNVRPRAMGDVDTGNGGPKEGGESLPAYSEEIGTHEFMVSPPPYASAK